ncbi:MAG: type 11 methyltransferase [Bacteroidetes bacterium OLB10]|nr:MAG: type 11 methyltransferase [Bacteroidetes bacterium OLB10]MCE7955206.1 class I SAM-dependent methyltransferase [Bacteroidetes bacterium CHB6]
MNCYIWPAFFKQVMIKELARKLLPSTARQKVSALYHEQKLFKAARVLAQAKGMSEVLDEKTFDTLMAAYPVGERMSYDNDSVKHRGDERANEMMEVMNRYGKGGFSDVLELGSGEGMVCAALQQNGFKATAIEYREDDFDSRAKTAGVSLLKMDAANLTFEDESFDFVFSYNCYEHFPSPEKVFQESLRVLRKGGLMSVRFAPLYHSPFGAHAYNIIGIPYCQFLFDKMFLNKWIAENSAEKLVIDDTLNRWHINQFRELFKKQFSDKAVVHSYEEFRLPHFADLIIQHPLCFKNKITSVDDLVVSEIHAVIEKK